MRNSRRITPRRTRPTDFISFKPVNIEMVRTNGRRADKFYRRTLQQRAIDRSDGATKERISLGKMTWFDVSAFYVAYISDRTEKLLNSRHIFINNDIDSTQT